MFPLILSRNRHDDMDHFSIFPGDRFLEDGHGGVHFLYAVFALGMRQNKSVSEEHIVVMLCLFFQDGVHILLRDGVV